VSVTGPGAAGRPAGQRSDQTWALRTDVDLDTVNLHISALEAAGLLGLVEEDGRVTAHFAARQDDLPVEGRWEPVPHQDWNAAWKTGIEPVTVGAVTVTPPWIDVPDALVIEPAMAFGTGHHETTAGCLAALQDEPTAGRSVLDVGTGTGLLALAAKLLGAARVVGVDTDEIAVRTAAANARLNGLDIEVWQGSVDTVPGSFDVVVANLDTATLVRLAGGLAATVAPEGRLVASGVGVSRSEEVRHALQAAGLRAEVRAGREWAVVVARHRPSPDR
jgi:ribosomal protein L11 methyltransferase